MVFGIHEGIRNNLFFLLIFEMDFDEIFLGIIKLDFDWLVYQVRSRRISHTEIHQSH